MLSFTILAPLDPRITDKMCKYKRRYILHAKIEDKGGGERIKKKYSRLPLQFFLHFCCYKTS